MSRGAHRLQDLAIGVRLAVGGGRTLKASLLRLVLTTIGIGLATAILLLVVTSASALRDRTDRVAARAPDTTAGQGTPVYLLEHHPAWDLPVYYLEPAGPNAPVPPGLRSIPAPGQIVVSPALAEKMREDPRVRGLFSQQVVGTIEPSGLAGPNELIAYAGGSGLRQSEYVDTVYAFGQPPNADSLPPQLLILGMIGVLVLLVPMLVFVASSSRIAGPERERRLSALRLAGAGAAQVRRIAAAESLVGAGTGALLGLLLYLVVRPFAAGLDLAGVTVYPADFVPDWPLVVLVFAIIPLISVCSAWLGLRSLIVEPLAVFRRGKPLRRRLWWRLVLVVAGVALLFADKAIPGDQSAGDMLPYVLLGGSLLLVGVPTLLPWLTERVVNRLRGGFPAWQLAVRRLQVDSGTPTRVVAGVVVVLAAVVALQTLLWSVEANANADRTSYYGADLANVSIETGLQAEVEPQVTALLTGVPGVRWAEPERWLTLRGPHGEYVETVVAPCRLLEHHFFVSGCTEGAAFTTEDLDPGMVLGSRSGQTFTVPADLERAAQRSREGAELLLTPTAAGALRPDYGDIKALLDPAVPDALDRVRSAVSPLQWRASVSAPVSENGDMAMLNATRALLYAGAVLTMLLAGISMLVLVIGQISERRRPFAAMTAAGVPRGVLSRSLLWQNALPVVFGVLVAIGAGIGVAAMLLRIMTPGAAMLLDWTFIMVMASAALVLVLLVSAAAVPGLRSVTKLEALRME
ncbi:MULTISPECIES: FtsX-like permease family protein [Amycolatopsis]|uniref:FtsX-like permease family protein n=2 Tax=Amycolatopsis TaxID=1813 RepID=A0A1I3UWE0_9PSEU|nr:FtsX-like permease family protein [Amycolatopsis sacchari]SFJ87498.1 FtsX-like permease family protein [Amycolatopsis sacchari]